MFGCVCFTSNFICIKLSLVLMFGVQHILFPVITFLILRERPVSCALKKLLLLEPIEGFAVFNPDLGSNMQKKISQNC